MRGALDSMPEVKDDVGLAERLLVAAGVALVPGNAFGASGYLRLSFATSTENLSEALDRLDTVFGVGWIMGNNVPGGSN